MAQLDSTIHYKYGLGYFEALDSEAVYRLHRFPTGHVGLALHDVDNTRHERFPINGRPLQTVFKEVGQKLGL